MGWVLSREELPLVSLASLQTRNRKSGSDAAFCWRSVWRVMGPLLGIDGMVTVDSDTMRSRDRPALLQSPGLGWHAETILSWNRIQLQTLRPFLHPFCLGHTYARLHLQSLSASIATSRRCSVIRSAKVILTSRLECCCIGLPARSPYRHRPTRECS